MSLIDLKLPTITKKPAAHYTQGRTEPVRAFVNHRMVGTLAGTDAYFTNPATRDVSTHFGIGYGDNGVVKISQYVPLDDSAYANGNYDPSGRWDEWGFKTTEINAQTISIEHQDHRDPAGKGVVSEKTQIASMKLQALLRYGSIAQWRGAGLWFRDWDRNAPIIAKEIRAIPVDGHHVITHHDIAGKLKPNCWLPWEKDTVGFPRAKYIDGIMRYAEVLRSDPVLPPTPPTTYTQQQLDEAIAIASKPLLDKIAALGAQLDGDKALDIQIANAIADQLTKLRA
jgi:hypothetical protein